jgi:outer membrane protein assembly factor BamB
MRAFRNRVRGAAAVLLVAAGLLLPAGGGGPGWPALADDRVAGAPQAPDPAVRTVWRVISGNGALVPLARDGDSLFAAGEAVAESWSLAGDLRWRVPLDTPAHFRPRVGAGVMAVVGRDGLRVLDADTGRVLWTATPTARFGAPFLHGGRLFLGDGGQLAAFRARDGRPLWRHAVEGNARVAYPPTALGGTLYLGGGDGRLTALDAATGAVRWSVDRGGVWQYLRQMAPAADGRVLVAGGYEDEVYGLDPATGAIVWRHDAGNFVNSQLVAHGRVHFWSPTGWMVALDAATGARVWRTRTHRFGADGQDDWSNIMAEPRADARRLWVLDMASTLRGLDLETGRVVSTVRLPFPARPFTLPVGDGSDVIVGSLGGEIARLHVPLPGAGAGAGSGVVAGSGAVAAGRAQDGARAGGGAAE